jgi:hypothetical protein
MYNEKQKEEAKTDTYREGHIVFTHCCGILYSFVLMFLYVTVAQTSFLFLEFRV